MRVIRSVEKANDIKISVSGGDSRSRDSVVSSIDSYLRKIRDNEELDVFVHREDKPDFVKISIGIGPHEVKQAILDGLASAVRKAAKSLEEVEVEVEEKMTNEKVASEILAIAREILEVQG